jgi:hypothetical protein
MYFGAETGRQVVLYVAFPDVTHSCSSRSGAHLKDVVWSKVWNAEGEKGKTECTSSIRCKALVRGDSLFPGSRLRTDAQGRRHSAFNADPYGLHRANLGNERKVESMSETARHILGPTKSSANWRCSDCAWSQPFVQRLERLPNMPSKAVEDAFDRHKCTEHRHPKWTR